MINGSILRLKLGLGAPATVGGPPTMLLVNEETKTDLNFKKETFEGTSKDSGRWRKRKSSFKDATIQCEAFVEFTPATGRASYAQMFAAYDQEAAVNAEFTTDQTGTFEFTGPFIVTELSTSAPTEQGATMSFTLVSADAVVGAVVA